jgi:Uma2 family endonuclease
MTTQAKPMTADELLNMPDDGFRYELVRGELRKMAPPGEEHGIITVEITLSLGNHVKARHLGKVYAAETGFKLASGPDTVRAPDVAFVSREGLEQQPPTKGYRQGAPDLAVEVLSPGDRYGEVEEKVFDWLDAGTKMVLVVNPDKRTVTVYRSRREIHVLTEDDAVSGADVVPGWSLPLRELFG